MTTPRPGQLAFTDCLGCGKRVATTAPLCRHCNTKRTPSPIAIIPRSSAASKGDEDHADDSHAALGLGGYGNDDIDDELELNKPKTQKRDLWWYVALVLLFIFAIGAFLPWF